MKQIFLTLLVTLCVSANLVAQAPQSVPYQAVARDASGNLIENQAISLRFTIHDGSASGTTVYEETQTATTNKLGLFNVNVGTGTIVSGTFAGINWSTGNKYMQVELDPAGGTSYQNMGTSQMMSVPYALYAQGAGPAGSAGGDLSGTYPNPTVVKINSSPLGTTTGATAGQVLEYNGTNWAPATPGAYVPSGVIVMWSGSFATIPSGWALCNGTSGTPNLTNQFILGATVTADVGVTGGNNSITLTVAQMPSHNHTGTTDPSAPTLTFTGTGGTTSAPTVTNTLGTDMQGAGQTGNIVWDDGSSGYYASGTLSLSQGTRNRSWGGSGGNAMRALNLAAHNHNITGSVTVSGSAFTPSGTISGSSHTHTFTTGSTGSGASIDIRPAFYKLAYIMKL